MCDIGKMFSGGGLGGILGGLAGTGLSILDPALGIPLFLGAGLGSGAGTFLGDVASGKSAGASLLPSLEAGGISGALAGAGNVLAGGDFFGAPASSLSGIFGGAAPTAATTDAASAATTAAAPATQLASTVATPAAASTAVGAPAAGGGAAIGDVTTALPTATGGAGASAANLGGSAIGSGGVPLSGPTGALGPSGAAGPTSLIPTDFSGGGDFARAATGAAAPGTTVVPSSITNPAFTTGNIQSAWDKMATAGDGGWFSSLFKAQPGGSFLSKGLAGEPGSIAADLTKPSTLITGGAALLPLLQGNTIPGLAAYQNQAKTLNAMGTPLAQALNTGNLPAGAQSALDAATRSAAAQVRSRYASMGLTGSSQEADALATVDQNAASQKYAELLRTTQQGISEMGMATPLLGTIMTTQLQQDQQQQQAIARLAAALAGSTGTEKTTA